MRDESRGFMCRLLMITLNFEIDLKQNKILSMDGTENVFFDSRNPEAREDYRQTMLSGVITHVENEDKNRLIQQLLPERLDAFLSVQKELKITFKASINGKKQTCRLTAVKQGDATQLSVELGIPDDEKNRTEIARCRLIVMVKDEIEEILQEKLSSDYKIICAKDSAEALSYIKEMPEAVLAFLADSFETKAECVSVCRESAVPVIAIADDEGIEAALGGGAFEVLRLPLNGDEIKNRIAHIAEHFDTLQLVTRLERDELTGLYVGATFYSKAEAEIKLNKKEYELIVLNIEDFQILGEKYGKTVLDMVLKHVTSRMTTCVPGVCFAGRIAASEFAVLREQSALENPSAIIDTLMEGAPIPDLEIKVGYVKVNQGIPVEMLCSRARTALQKIQRVYGVNVAEYNDIMAREGMKELQILGSMEAALENEQFSVYYQPKHDSQTGKTVGAEALVRWYHPQLGNLNPGQFIPLFERVGFIRGMDRYLWTKVCQNIRRRKDAGLPVVPISVNLSRRDFEIGDLAEWFIAITARFGIEHELLHLEITESAYSADVERITDCVHRLHEAGFIIELDDFGTGYSSLMCINNMDIDVLKIDKSIVQNETQGSKRSILEFCIRLAKMMGMKTVAEGVETESQYRRVQTLKCDQIQGFYFSHPLDSEEFDRYLERHLD